ncbi:MAG: DUF4159 domain-containing protein [Cyanobacteria bacterium J06638_28]
MQLFSPHIKAFEQLQAADGLLITADHWQRTQNYHRHRQNFYYQSLFQAGIVKGLGVAVIQAPEEVEARYRNNRWIQVQPGIAIDAEGNPIVVVEPCSFQVQSVCHGDQRKTVYIVLNYVDPSDLRQLPGQDWVQETFRILEKTSLDVLDVELCRIHLRPGETALIPAIDVFFPEANSLDLNHRQPAQKRPAGGVTVAPLVNPQAPNPKVTLGLTYLLKALPALYPDLMGTDDMLLELDWGAIAAAHLQHLDLLYLSHSQLAQVPSDRYDTLKTYLDQGGSLLIAVDGAITRQQELAQIKQELETTLTEGENDPDVAAVADALRAELTEIQTEMTQFVQTLQQSVLAFAQQLNLPASGSGELSPDHPLRTTPFLFSGWPRIEALPVQFFSWGGLILMVGNLTAVWGPDATGARSRDTIRTAHEMGINLLHYAWRRRQLIQCQAIAPQTVPLPQQNALIDQVTP